MTQSTTQNNDLRFASFYDNAPRYEVSITVDPLKDSKSLLFNNFNEYISFLNTNAAKINGLGKQLLTLLPNITTRVEVRPELGDLLFCDLTQNEIVLLRELNIPGIDIYDYHLGHVFMYHDSVIKQLNDNGPITKEQIAIITSEIESILKTSLHTSHQETEVDKCKVLLKELGSLPTT